MTDTTTDISVISFGYGHGAPPEAHVTINISKRLPDPHISPELRQMTGRDRAVQEKVMGTPGAHFLLGSLESLATAMHVDGQPFTIAIGCVGGRHRSVVLANQLAYLLGCTATHRDIDKAVIAR